MPDHFTNTLKKAFAHEGFSFVHVLQRCPHFDPGNFDYKSSTTWFSFLTHANGIPPDKQFIDKAKVIQHDPADKDTAFAYANKEHVYFGLLHQRFDKPRYDKIIHAQIKEAKSKPRENILDAYKI